MALPEPPIQKDSMTAMTAITPGIRLRPGQTPQRGGKANPPAPLDPATTPWDGGIDEDEALRSGGLLIGALVARAAQLNHPLKDMAITLGVTYGYIAQLRGGHREIENLSADFITAAADYLGVSRAFVLIMQDRLPFEEPLELGPNMARLVTPALQFISQDPEYAGLLPVEVFDMSLESQYFVVRLYEQATGKALLRDKRGTVAFSRDLEAMRALEAELREEVAQARARKAKTKQAA